MDTKHSMYRVSVKALIFNEDDRVFLIDEGETGWELPGGGMDHGESPQETLRREIKEETNLTVTSISDTPIRTWVQERSDAGVWVLFLGYKVEVENLDDFVPTDEAFQYKFCSVEEMLGMKLHINISQLPDIL